MKCPACGVAFNKRRSDQTFCSSSCGKVYETLELKRARVIYRALYYAANAKKSDPGRGLDLTFVMREARAWAAEDRVAGREGPPRHDHGADRGHQRRAA